MWSDFSDNLLDKLTAEYQDRERPVEIDVRSDVDWVRGGDRLTHGLHSYPARLIRHIPVLFLHSTRYSKPNDLVVDPFCGSGTVLVEGIAARRRVLGADANPLARLISQVKVTALPESTLVEAIERSVRRAPRQAKHMPDVVNRDYWFTPAASQQLARLRHGVEAESDQPTRDFLRVCLSAAARKSSLADPRVSVPVRLRRNQYAEDHWLHAKTNALLDAAERPDVFATFRAIGRDNARRVATLLAAGFSPHSTAVPSDDARFLRSKAGQRLRTGSARMVLTSPPYLGAQKYIRATSLGLGWLGFNDDHTLRELEDMSIGREHFRKATIDSRDTGVDAADHLIRDVREANPLRAHIASTYLIEMRSAMTEIHRALAPGGTLVMVSGSNLLCGRPFHTTAYLTSIARDLGLSLDLELVDTIRSRGLMTRRNTSAGVIETEAVSVFRKSERGPA